MERKYIDCRDYPSEMNCTVAISADNDDELLEAAVQHAVAVHSHEDTPDLRQQIKSLFRQGSPELASGLDPSGSVAAGSVGGQQMGAH
ncbi:MAG: DUF1059 domain-containing protein [Pseudomonadota bacterium]